MTNEEAIMILKAMIDEMILAFDNDRKKALNMAIEALKEQPEHDQNTSSKQPDLETLGIKTGETCEDAISRQAAIDAFMKVTSDGDKAEWCKWVLEQLPSVQPKVIACGSGELNDETGMEWVDNAELVQAGEIHGSVLETVPIFGEDTNDE